MPRWPRLVAPGFPLHITQRGHNQEDTFLDDTDRGVFRELLRLSLTRFPCELHAYALMTNHIHLLLTPSGKRDASHMMQSLTGRFVRYWNRRHRRSGTLWGGRFHSSIVDTERYLLASVRYIDLNPVRAGIVRAPEDYEWSSYRHLALRIPDPLVTLHPVVRALASGSGDAAEEYARFCTNASTAAELDEIRAATRGGGAVATLRTREALQRQLQHPVTRSRRGGDRRSEAFRSRTHRAVASDA